MRFKFSKLFFLLIVCWLSGYTAFAQRTITGLNGYWQFSKSSYQPGSGDTTSLGWETISLPHTWNNKDAYDDVPGFYRGLCWYKKSIQANSNWKGKKVYLYFDGANQQTKVYVNGHIAGSHTGGYTRFAIAIEKYLDFNPLAKNEIAISVDNTYNENIPPLTADFTFFGGIYRQLSLVVTSPVHFDMSYASTGVYVTTPQVSEASATVKTNGLLSADGVTKGKLLVVTTVSDEQAKVVLQKKTVVKSNTSQIAFTQEMQPLSNPHLWSPENPYLYHVLTQLIDTQTGKVIDELSNPLGFRWFKFDADKGFFLNGKSYKLMGASRHQDFKDLGNALTRSYHVQDIQLLKNMGANFLRVAHYPQDPAILETCDKLGILTSVEIPVVNYITESEAFTQNCENMQVEMIHQNYNHPSVIIWGYMNEILLQGRFTNDKDRQQLYFTSVNKLARRLDSLTRRQDPTRYTMLACHGDFDKYKRVGLVQIPQLVGWNLYQGWYGGSTADFAKFLDRHHQEFPDKPLLVTEFGADVDSRVHSFEPVRFDKSSEYATGFQQVYLNAILARPFVAAAAVWNLADFSSEVREETMPHMNTKGLLTWDRQPKDQYKLYQAYLWRKSFVALSGWKLRSGIADSLNQNQCTQPLTVFSNAGTVQLTVNGKSLSIQTVKDGAATWQVPFINGLNRVEAAIIVNGKTYTDVQGIQFNLLPWDLKHDTNQMLDINVLLGAKRYYIQEDKHCVWLPAQPYHEGGFGYEGGRPFNIPGDGRLSYGTNKNIQNTDDDAIYQTQQAGIKQYRFDVPDGSYQLVLHFAELTTSKTKAALAYNLDNSKNKEVAQSRSFNVIVNGDPVLENFNPAQKYGTLTAGAEQVDLIVTGGKGITINFQPVKGEAVLNAIQLRKK